MYRRAELRGITMPTPDRNGLHKLLRAGGAPGGDPESRAKVLAAMPGIDASKDGRNWLHFDFCNQFLQSSEELHEAAADLVRRQYTQDNTLVIEIRFAPVLHCLEGLTPEAAVQAVVSGFEHGVLECTGECVGRVIVGGIIICAMRTLEASHGVEMAELASKWLGCGVVGWDLAADEGAHPLQKHLLGLQRALELGVPTTVHAGEWGSGEQSESNPTLFTKPGHYDTIPNIRLAVDEGCQRLGHGLTMFMDPNLMQDVVQKQLVVECCLTSNVRRIRGYHEHPISDMIQSGVKCTINTDNRFLGGTTSTEEILHAVRDVGLGWDAVKECLMNAANGTFYWQVHGCNDERERWITEFEAKIDRVFSDQEVR